MDAPTVALMKRNPVAERRIAAMVRISLPVKVSLLRQWRNYLSEYTSPDAIARAQQ